MGPKGALDEWSDLLKSASRSNVKAKCRHALKEKCIVAREQNWEGPWAFGSGPWWRSSSGKVQLSRHCGRGRSPLCKTVQHVTGCQYQVPHKQCHSASVTTPYLSPMLQRTVQELLLLKTTPGKMKRTQRKGFWVDCCSGIQICVFKEIFLTIIRLTLTTSISVDTVPSLCRLLGVSPLRENANSGSSNNGSYRVWGEGPQTAVPCHCHNHTTLT